MVTLRVMDSVFVGAHREGKISLYMPSHGEEAINISSAAALSPEDFVFAQVHGPHAPRSHEMSYNLQVCTIPGWPTLI